MRAGRFVFALIVLLTAVTVFDADYSRAEVICANKRTGDLKLRPDKCMRNENEVDLGDIEQFPGLTPARWSWLGEDGGTYWYVPPVNLPAVMWNTSDPANYSPVSDQTVWHIESYADGYFFGTVVAQFGITPPACQYLIGSVTPDGNVFISFNPLQASSEDTVTLTTGTGKMAFKDGEWTFLMQMASGSSSAQITHWAYMLECTPDEECWANLPGVEKGIEEFLSNCE
ncbi:MAG TPA: hypothetical protein PKC29_00560 [Thermodesulfobacteriota bacterium]|nr:hypothetical protein [Thermodesulfobacteriota bacterium]